jgi:hypothetical protein
MKQPTIKQSKDTTPYANLCRFTSSRARFRVFKTRSAAKDTPTAKEYKMTLEVFSLKNRASVGIKKYSG